MNFYLVCFISYACFTQLIDLFFNSYKDQPTWLGIAGRFINIVFIILGVWLLREIFKS